METSAPLESAQFGELFPFIPYKEYEIDGIGKVEIGKITVRHALAMMEVTKGASTDQISLFAFTEFVRVNDRKLTMDEMMGMPMFIFNTINADLMAQLAKPSVT